MQLTGQKAPHPVCFQVDSDTVWNVIHSDIIELKERITHYLSETNWDEWENTKE